jgi:hypothetical protein
MLELYYDHPQRAAAVASTCYNTQARFRSGAMSQLVGAEDITLTSLTPDKYQSNVV